MNADGRIVQPLLLDGVPRSLERGLIPQARLTVDLGGPVPPPRVVLADAVETHVGAGAHLGGAHKYY